MNQVIDIRRIGLLARKDFLQNWRVLLIGTGGIAGVVLLSAIIHAFVGSSASYEEFLRAPLFITGIIAASYAFSELHNKNKNDDYLLLPASALEKTLVRLLEVSLAVPLFGLIVVALAALIAESVRFLAFGLPFNIFNPFVSPFWKDMLNLIVIQSVFFLGGAWFKKNHLIKTALTVIVFFIIIVLFTSVLGRIVFSQYFGGSLIPDFNSLWKMKTALTIGKILLYGLLPPFCWIMAWVRVAETQSSDGI